MLLESLLALVGVCLLAWVALRWMANAGVGTGAGKRMRVLERVAVDPRRALVLVEVGGRVLLLGTGDGAAPSLIAEIDAKSLPADDTRRAATFGEVLARLKGAPVTPSEVAAASAASDEAAPFAEPSAKKAAQ